MIHQKIICFETPADHRQLKAQKAKLDMGVTAVYRLMVNLEVFYLFLFPKEEEIFLKPKMGMHHWSRIKSQSKLADGCGTLKRLELSCQNTQLSPADSSTRVDGTHSSMYKENNVSQIHTV